MAPKKLHMLITSTFILVGSVLFWSSPSYFLTVNYEASPMTSDEVFLSRRLKMEQACTSWKTDSKSMKPSVITHESSGLLYCLVPKAGCSFWKMVMRALNEYEVPNITNTFSLSLVDIHYKINLLLKYDENKFSSEKYPIRFLVARDPFSRLLSTYLDKFYLPDFWFKGTEIRIASRKRKLNDTKKDFFKVHFQKLSRKFPNPPNGNISCVSGKSITFAQFVESVFTYENEHWNTVQRLCNPCELNITHISTMKTFSNDARAILAHSSNGVHLLDDFDSDLQVHRDMELVAEYQLRKVLGSDVIKGCTTIPEVAQRLWNNFQWRGYIHPQVDLDLNKELLLAQTVTQKTIGGVIAELLRQLKNARARGLKEPKLMKQAKEEFKKQAFQSLPKSAFPAILKRYERDFRMFGFDEEIEKIRSLMFAK